MDVILIVLGLALLFAGGEGLLRGSVAIAEKLGLSTLLVSMVIVGFGTSAPEFMVSLTAALKGAPDIALGNVVGSNIANILLILGFSALVAPLACGRREIRRDAFAVLLASLVLVALTMTGSVSRLAGFVMLATLAAYLSYAFLSERRNSQRNEEFRERLEEDIGTPKMGLWLASLFCLAGLLFLSGGAHFLVEGATALARKFGISNAIIGLTLVAAGTSMPELATAIVAAYRKHADVVIGNVIGSNLFNILGVLGGTAVILPIPLEGRLAEIDVWIMLAVAIVLSPVIWTGHRISRLEGGTLLTLYLAYITWLYTAGLGHGG
jgi:cation:H+ antiporter